MKDTVGVSERFRLELAALVESAWREQSGTITRDMRALLRRYVEDAYFEGLLAGDASPDRLSKADQKLIDKLTAEQASYVAQFAKDVQDAAEDAAQQSAMRQRIELWAEGIAGISQRGWVSAMQKTGRRIRWHTARDELTCPVCAPLNDKIVLAGEPFGDDANGAPIYNAPAHPRCRCTVTEYVD